MVVYTFMNFIESVAIERPIEFYNDNELIAYLTINEHDERYQAFMSQYGLDEVQFMDFDEYSNCYIVKL